MVCGRRHLSDRLDFCNAPSVCPPSSVFRRGVVTLGDDSFADGGPPAVVTERSVLGEECNSFLLLGDLKILCQGLAGLFSLRVGSPGRLAVCWCIWSMWSCSGTKLRTDVTCVVLSHRRQNGALCTGVVEKRANGSLALESGNLSAMTGNAVIRSDCIDELDVDLS